MVSARRLAAGLLAVLVAFALVPWQQTAASSGRVIAFDPAAREQWIEAPVAGMVKTWHVVEGQQVKAGDPLVELVDNDPSRLARMQTETSLRRAELQASQAKVSAAIAKRDAAVSGLEAKRLAMEAKIEASRRKVSAAREKVAAVEPKLWAAERQLARTKTLVEEDYKSVRDLDKATAEFQELEADLARAKADLQGAEADLQETLADRDGALRKAEGDVAEAESKLEAARKDAAAAEGKVVEMEGKVARQEAQVLRAPMDGVVTRISGGVRGKQVKKSDQLLLLVPTDASRAVELRVDGLDAPLVRPGEEVRLQFEGWPALQFSGWPSVAIGTFGGEVLFVDSADDGKGGFRVVVVPTEDDHPWPEAGRLRRGVKAKGWVMLSQVPLGYELWRQLNDFPASLPEEVVKDEIKGPAERSKVGGAWKK